MFRKLGGKSVETIICLAAIGTSLVCSNAAISASGLTVGEEEKEIVVENPYYKAVITPEGARITSLILKKSGNNFARGWEGISETVEMSGYKGHAGRLGVERYTYEIFRESADSVKVQFTYHGKPDCLINWLMTYQKTFTFLEKSPLIKVELSLKNVGDSERFTQFRVHNRVAAGEGVDENDIYFLPTTEGMKEIKFAKKSCYVHNFTAGLAGVIDRETKDALLFFPDYDSVNRFYFWMGGSGKKKATTIEWYYRSFVLGRGDIWQTSYFILPTTLSSLSGLQTCLKEHGIRVNPSTKVKKSQRPMNISRRETGLVKAGDINSFNRLIASKPIREMAMGEGKIEKNVRMAHNRIYSRIVFTETGAGYEVNLPDAKDIVIEAEIMMKTLGDEKKEAYLACCDPAGNIYSVTKPLTLSFRKKDGFIKLPVSELAGREIRILLYGRGVNWTSLSIVSSKGREGIFTPISSWTEDTFHRFIEAEEKDIKEPVEVFVEGLISSIPELSYEIHDTNGKVVAQEKNLSMRKVSGKESLFSARINAISDCEIKYSINAGGEKVNNRLLKKQKAPFKLLYNNDTTNTAGNVSPWHEDGEPFREEMLIASIEEVANTGVDAYMLSPGMGWVPWWQSEVEADFFEWWKTRTGLEVLGGYDKYVYEGGDMVEVLIDTCRRHGMAPFVSLRLNDVHQQENYAQKNQKSLVSCRFYVEHPDWHIDPDHPEHKGYYKKRGMDWAVPEVREYKLSLLTELAEKYDLTGIELDFLRDNTLFRPGEVDEATRVEIITDFVKQVRAALDRKTSKDAKRYLCVRIPLELAAHSAIGLDVQRLWEAGVDMFNLSGWYETTQRSDIANIRKLVPYAAIYLEMTHSTGWHPYFLKPGLYGSNGDPRTSDHQFYTTALLAHRRGADGLSLFNFVYYRMGHKDDVLIMEPPFHVLRKINDTEFLSRQCQYYMLAGTCYYRQVPREIAVHQATVFEMDMVPPWCGATGNRTEHGGAILPRLRVHTEHELTTRHMLSVSFNGTILKPCSDVSRFFGNPFDPMISPLGNRRAWLLPNRLIRDGLNSVRVELEAGDPVKLIYIDAGIP